MNGNSSDCEISIRWDSPDHNKTDRLSRLLRLWAQEENLSVHITVTPRPLPEEPCDDPLMLLDTNAIRYVTSDGHHCLLHMAAGILRLRVPFHTLTARLLAPNPAGSCYLFISRGVLVHQGHIAGHTRDSFLMDDGALLPIRRKDRTRLTRAFDLHALVAAAPESPADPDVDDAPGGPILPPRVTPLP